VTNLVYLHVLCINCIRLNFQREFEKRVRSDFKAFSAIFQYLPTGMANEAINMPQKENTHCRQLPGFYVFIQVEEPPASHPLNHRTTEPLHHILPHCVNMLATNYEKQHLLWAVVCRMLHVQQQHRRSCAILKPNLHFK